METQEVQKTRAKIVIGGKAEEQSDHGVVNVEAMRDERQQIPRTHDRGV